MPEALSEFQILSSEGRTYCFELLRIHRNRTEQVFRFDISLCSKKMTQLVREVRAHAENHIIMLRIGNPYIRIWLVDGHLRWQFKPVEVTDSTQYVGVRRVGNLCFTQTSKRRKLNSYEYICLFNDMQLGVAEVSKHLAYIFQAPIELELHVAFSREFHTLCSYPHVQHVRSLKINGGIMMKEHLKDIFDNVQVEKSLFICPETDDDYVIRQALVVEELVLGSCTWMTRDHLLQIKCRTADFYGHRFGFDDLVAFAENWLNNKNSPLERVCFRWSNGLGELKLDGLNTQQWDPNLREQTYLLYDRNAWHRIDCSRGLDLVRDDGALATLVYHPYDLASAIFFFVWNERFPERKRLQNLPHKLAPYYEQLERLNNIYTDSTSIERLLSNPTLKPQEFLDTYRVFRNMDNEGDVQEDTEGRVHRRTYFDSIYEAIELQRPY